MICVPATLTGVVVAAIVSMFVGKDLKDDPEYQARLAAAIPAPKARRRAPAARAGGEDLRADLPRAASALVVLFGFFPRRCARCRRQERARDADRHRDRDAVGRRA